MIRQEPVCKIHGNRSLCYQYNIYETQEQIVVVFERTELEENYFIELRQKLDEKSLFWKQRDYFSGVIYR